MGRKYIQLSVFILFVLLFSYPLFLNIDKLSVRMWDEARNGINAIEMLQNGKIFVTHFDNQPDMWNSKPPLLIWSVAISMKIFGLNTFALRLPSVLSCLAIAIYCFFYFKKYFNSILIGIISGFVLVTSVGFIDYHVSRNGDFDGMLSMWMFFYSTQFFIYLINRNRKNLILFSFYLACAILTKGIAGCLVLPGLLIFLITSKEHFSVFKKKELYLLPLLGFFVGILYYIIREQLNSGYISAVIENEITGRYTATNEGHVGSSMFYIDLLVDAHFKYWIYFLPCCILLVFFQSSFAIKKAMLFLIIQSLAYLFVVTFSHTKLPWYDAPLFPFFAAIIALGVYQLLIEIINIIKTKNDFAVIFIKGVIILLIFIVPVQNILATSIRGEKETYYQELFYGDFMNNVFSYIPKQHKIIVVSEDYNPHLIFYKKVAELKGKEVEIKNPRGEFNYNDSIMVCESKMFPQLDSVFVLDTIYQEDNLKYFIRISSSEDMKKSNLEKLILAKINEIKNNLEWNTSIIKKAKENNLSYEKQLMNDVLWIINNNSDH